MKQTKTAQAKSGLRLGVGLGSFLIGLMFLGTGMERVAWPALPPHYVVWSDPIGWVELILATAMLLASAGVWWQLLAGCMLFAFFKSVIVLITGRNLFRPYGPIPRLVSVELIVFCLAALLLMWRFAKGRITILDRIALTVFLLSFGWSANTSALSAAVPGLTAGLVVLGFSSYMHRRKMHKSKPTCPSPKLKTA